ncbi:MAG: type I-C CRISPR-associated protein Cas8c/Csd1 [Clostridiales bacterium]|nr:type I-C CRISPR-associated protein Cas8c/Csd1 [Clostridiales bacterium]
MLIQALCEYYDILEKQGNITPKGYTKVLVDYLICLTPEGKIDEIIDWRKPEEYKDKKGKRKVKYVSREELLPERSQKPGIDLNIIEHRPLYIFGLNYEKGKFTTIDKTEKAKKSHQIFVEGNIEFIEGIDSPIVNAYRNFLINWNPEDEMNNPNLLSLGTDYNKGYFCFSLSGNINELLHNDEAIGQRWKRYCLDRIKSANENEKISQCAVTGKYMPIARTHYNKIKGVKGGQAAGTVLVSYKNDSETSYNKGQSYNSNISESVMLKYTKSLNYLLGMELHKTFIDDMTVVHWAHSNDNKDFDILMKFLVFDEKLYDEDLDTELKGIFNHLMKGTKAEFETLNIDENTTYYIFGLVPNNSRLSIKFFFKDKFGSILRNVTQHQKDLLIEGNKKQIPVWIMKRELISPKSNDDKISPSLLSGIFKSIFFGTNYPEELLSTIIRRVKTDSDEEKDKFVKMNSTRIGIIKACINRKCRLNNKEEVIKMSLDPQNSNSAYLCGRLFALLEKVQQKASKESLNKTIKDSYFATACSTPSVVFSKLLVLSQNHLAKLEPQYEKYWNKKIAEVINMLGTEFPQTLSLTEQGIFIIGYYQQFYSKKDDVKKEEVQNGNN